MLSNEAGPLANEPTCSRSLLSQAQGRLTPTSAPRPQTNLSPSATTTNQPFFSSGQRGCFSSRPCCRQRGTPTWTTSLGLRLWPTHRGGSHHPLPLPPLQLPRNPPLVQSHAAWSRFARLPLVFSWELREQSVCELFNVLCPIQKKCCETKKKKHVRKEGRERGRKEIKEVWGPREQSLSLNTPTSSLSALLSLLTSCISRPLNPADSPEKRPGQHFPTSVSRNSYIVVRLFLQVGRALQVSPGIARGLASCQEKPGEEDGGLEKTPPSPQPAPSTFPFIRWFTHRGLGQ